MGFAEAYMEGTLETSDIGALLRWGAANHDGWFESPFGRVVTPLRALWLRIRPERRHPRVRSMVDHYNLGNDFYRAWLDPSLTYSSARFTHPDQPLEAAQRHKYETIARHAGLHAGMRVLEIGCGWGGFAEYAAAELGCSVVGITISDEQARFARKRLAGRGLTDLVEIELMEFRDVAGTFDAIVSIEMIESIDERQWPDLFECIARSLAPGARAAMQAITIADPLWDHYRNRPDFIQQYIFPGGQLPAPKVMRKLADQAGLVVEQIDTFGLDYARTLAHWHNRFSKAWPDLEGQGGLDERFRRMWDLYLTMCEAGFRSGRVNVEQWVLSTA
jgi:cyclopropane-fatty-acyl-phospholipid synthase